MSIFNLENTLTSNTISYAYPSSFINTDTDSPVLPESKTIIRYDREILVNSDKIADGRTDTQTIDDPKRKIQVSQGRYNFFTAAGQTLGGTNLSSYIYFENGKFISNNLGSKSQSSAIEEIYGSVVSSIIDQIDIMDLL